MCPLAGSLSAAICNADALVDQATSARRTPMFLIGCMMISSTWWCNSGDDLTASWPPSPHGSFVRRVARTPHYDRVIQTMRAAIIAIFGIGHQLS